MTLQHSRILAPEGIILLFSDCTDDTRPTIIHGIKISSSVRAEESQDCIAPENKADS